MSDLRRQRRKAIKESKLNKTNTKIDAQLAEKLDYYLTDSSAFKHQIALCEELGLEYPKNAKSGYELPLFNKNPLTNEIEIHGRSAELFEIYQYIFNIANLAVGLDDESDEYNMLSLIMTAMSKDVSFGKYFIQMVRTAEEKGLSVENALYNNKEEITEKAIKIFAQ